jgi:hypothetical protein
MEDIDVIQLCVFHKKKTLLKNIFYVAIGTLTFSCNSNTEKINSTATTTDTQILDKQLRNELLEKAINLGDTLSYDKAASMSFQNNDYSGFYFYSMMMANKYNYSRAYYDLYLIMGRKGLKINNVEMYSDDANSRKMANYFLIKSYELGLKEAFTDLKKTFDKNIPRSEDYLCDKR